MLNSIKQADLHSKHINIVRCWNIVVPVAETIVRFLKSVRVKNKPESPIYHE